jgi:hypothetical protein
VFCGGGAILVKDCRLGVRRVGRVLLDAADEIERGVKRLVVLRIRRDIGLRAGLLIAFGLEVSAQRRDGLRARVPARAIERLQGGAGAVESAGVGHTMKVEVRRRKMGDLQFLLI